MKLQPPKGLTVVIALLLVVFGIIASYLISTLAPFAIWFVVAGFVLLLLGNLIKGL